MPDVLAALMEAARGWIENLGPAGIALFVAAYVAATVFLVPTWIFTLAAGAVFGVGRGLVLVVVSAVAGATLSFLLARLGLRARVAHAIVRRPLLDAVDQALREKGWQVVALLRLTPVPFGVQNYLFGLSGVKLAHFIPATAAGIVPVTTLYLFVGASGRDALERGSPERWALLGGGWVAAIVVSWILARAARTRLGLKGQTP
jgi:uncharacterized membrane protein YdjX (TVP38/TMEM64 family)